MSGRSENGKHASSIPPLALFQETNNLLCNRKDAVRDSLPRQYVQGRTCWDLKLGTPWLCREELERCSMLSRLVNSRLRQYLSKSNTCWKPQKGVFYCYRVFSNVQVQFYILLQLHALGAGVAAKASVQRIAIHIHSVDEGAASGGIEGKATKHVDVLVNQHADCPLEVQRSYRGAQLDPLKGNKIKLAFPPER